MSDKQCCCPEPSAVRGTDLSNEYCASFYLSRPIKFEMAAKLSCLITTEKVLNTLITYEGQRGCTAL